MPTTALYAALLTPLMLVLAARVIRHRRVQRVEIGDGDDPELLRRMRVHANFVETVPFALILLALVEQLGVSPWLLHAIGAPLLVGRYAHAYGLSQTPHIMRLRVLGMILTLTPIGLAAAVALVASLVRLV